MSYLKGTSHSSADKMQLQPLLLFLLCLVLACNHHWALLQVSAVTCHDTGS